MLARNFNRLRPPSLCRNYAFTRLSERRRGVGRQRPGKPMGQTDTTWQTNLQSATSDPREALQTMLLDNKTLVVERQLEMLNIFIGFEQCNRYVINNLDGEPLGYITEEPGSFMTGIGRQLFGTHRPFRAMVMDLQGAPLLWLRRNFSWINSRMYVQRRKDLNAVDSTGEPILDTFAEVQQVWHPIRRRYDLFLKEGPERILSVPSKGQPTPEPSTFMQFAHVDSGFLAWDFKLRDARGEEAAFVTRSFRGFGRELFTDTGMYAIHFGPAPPPEESIPDGFIHRPQTIDRDLTLDERALTLALAINIDFDYFSRHSGHIGGLGLFHIGGD